MKMKKIEIKNYRSLHNVEIDVENVTAIIGRNNSGKSNIIKGLELLFEGSTKLVNRECFFNHNLNVPIEIVVTFTNLSDWEKEQFKSWMDDEDLIVGRIISSEGDDSFNIDTIAIIKVPEHEWLQDNSINSENITKWWAEKSNLKIGNLDFETKLGSSKPTVSKWKEIAKKFVEDYGNIIPWKKEVLKNPKGYPGVLKGALPEFIYIPAVRDVGDEIKVAKTNPFGQLIHSILEKISEDQKELISNQLKEIEIKLNRGDDTERISEIKRVETRFNELMTEIMDCDVEIEMNMPSLKEVFGGARLYVNDGVRTPIDSKGHGMQRSMILTILRAYAEFAHIKKAGDMSNQRSTVIAIEEPEIYLHPQLQRTLASVFQDIANGRDQIIFTSQSSLFIDISQFDQICIMRQQEREGCFEGCPTQLTVSKMITDLEARKGVKASEESIRELYSHVFNPIINEGFFADKVVIVEGPSEQYSLPIYAEALGYNLNRHNVSIIHSDGKGPIDRLHRVFAGFKIPTYIIFDGDKGTTDKASKEKTLELLEMVEDPVNNFEEITTKITEKYTILEYKLEILLQDEIPNYEEIIKESTKVLGPVGKPLKHRYIAKWLTQKIVEGRKPEEILPKTIIEIIKQIQNLPQANVE